MPRKRKRAREHEQGDPSAARKPPPRVGTELGAVLKQAGLARVRVPPKQPAPKPVKPQTLPPPGPARPSIVPPPKAAGVSATPLSMNELRMLNDAYEGARPLQQKTQRARPKEEGTPPARSRESLRQDRADELAARTRLAELVAGGARFKIRREVDYVEGLRADTSPKLLARIQGKGFTPEATLDLHGLRAAEVGPRVERFVRMHHRRGARHVLLIVGKGLHSDDGASVLGPVVVEALSQGLAAPWVIAFSTAHTVHGGSGALAVLLR